VTISSRLERVRGSSPRSSTVLYFVYGIAVRAIDDGCIGFSDVYMGGT